MPYNSVFGSAPWPHLLSQPMDLRALRYRKPTSVDPAMTLQKTTHQHDISCWDLLGAHNDLTAALRTSLGAVTVSEITSCPPSRMTETDFMSIRRLSLVGTQGLAHRSVPPTRARARRRSFGGDGRIFQSRADTRKRSVIQRCPDLSAGPTGVPRFLAGIQLMPLADSIRTSRRARNTPRNFVLPQPGAGVDA